MSSWHDFTSFYKSISKTVTDIFTTVFTCLCPPISRDQEIENAPLDIFGVLQVGYQATKVKADGTRENQVMASLQIMYTKKERSMKVCLAKCKKSEWAFPGLEENNFFDQ